MIMQSPCFSGCDMADVVGRMAKENCSVHGDHGAERQGKLYPKRYAPKEPSPEVDPAL